MTNQNENTPTHAGKKIIKKRKERSLGADRAGKNGYAPAVLWLTLTFGICC